MDDDLFTYEVEIANIPCNLRVDDDSEHEVDDMGFDQSDIAFTECWINDGYCNGGNLPGTFIIENQLHYQDYEWYEALEDSELKAEALRNKAIMEGFIKDDDDESSEEYVAIKEDEYDNLARTSNNACRTYQEIFRMMDEGWMVTRAD
ncbi:hypothetical protein Tco_0853191 [Tanacetum coccineum]